MKRLLRRLKDWFREKAEKLLEKAFPKLMPVIAFTATMALLIWYPLKESVTYILKGHSIVGRIFLSGVYGGLVLLAVFKPIGLYIILGIAAAIWIAVTIYVYRTSWNKEDFYRDWSGSRTDRAEGRNPFFEGMNAEQAKKEYRQLMKKYHPDNPEGDLEMSQKVVAAYQRFCREHS